MNRFMSSTPSSQPSDEKIDKKSTESKKRLREQDDFKKLTKTYMSFYQSKFLQNQLSEQKVSKEIDYPKFIIDLNSSEDNIQILLAHLSGSAELNLKGKLKNITLLQAQKLGGALRLNHSIQNVDLSDCKFESRSIGYIFAALLVPENVIERLFLSNCSLALEDLSHEIPYLEGNMPSMFEAFTQGKIKLKVLDYSDNKLPHLEDSLKHSPVLLRSLHHNPYLESLNLCSKFGSFVFSEDDFIDFLKNNKKLRSIRLGVLSFIYHEFADRVAATIGEFNYSISELEYEIHGEFGIIGDAQSNFKLQEHLKRNDLDHAARVHANLLAHTELSDTTHIVIEYYSASYCRLFSVPRDKDQLAVTANSSNDKNEVHLSRS